MCGSVSGGDALCAALYPKAMHCVLLCIRRRCAVCGSVSGSDAPCAALYPEAPCRRVDMEVRRYGVLETRCRCADMEVRRYGALETRCRCADMEGWSSGALEVRCRRADVEAWSSGGVPQVQACRHGGAWGDALCLLEVVEGVFRGRKQIHNTLISRNLNLPQRKFRETDVESSEKLKGQGR